MPQKTEKDFWVEMSIREMQTQSEFAEIAYSNIDPKAGQGNRAVFSSIHSFLSHCAIISKMLKAHVNRDLTKSIGSVLNIPDSSIIHTRTFRNNLEHYDRELKKWIKKYGPNSNIGTYNIGPKSMIQIPNMVFVSHYDPVNKQFTFVNKEFDLGPLFNETQRIKGITENWIKQMQNGQIIPPFL